MCAADATRVPPPFLPSLLLLRWSAVLPAGAFRLPNRTGLQVLTLRSANFLPGLEGHSEPGSQAARQLELLHSARLGGEGGEAGGARSGMFPANRGGSGVSTARGGSGHGVRAISPPLLHPPTAREQAGIASARGRGNVRDARLGEQNELPLAAQVVAAVAAMAAAATAAAGSSRCAVRRDGDGRGGGGWGRVVCLTVSCSTRMAAATAAAAAVVVVGGRGRRSSRCRS